MNELGRKVLIVEDEPLVRMLAEEDFAELGFEVSVAESGDRALVMIDGDAQLDLLFTDIRMPGDLDGWQLARRVRDARPQVAVIYASGYSEEMPTPVPGALFLKKPYVFDDLRHAVARLGLGPAASGADERSSSTAS